jgi:hypothetical protein
MIFFNLECDKASKGKRKIQTISNNPLFHYQRLKQSKIKNKNLLENVEVTKSNQQEKGEFFQRIINPNKETGIYIKNGYFEVELLDTEKGESSDFKNQKRYKIILEPMDYVVLKGVKVMDFKYLGPGGPIKNGNISLLN